MLRGLLSSRILLLVMRGAEACQAGSKPENHAPTIGDEWSLFRHPSTWHGNSERIEFLLSTGRVDIIKPMREYLAAEKKIESFNNQVFVVHLSNGMKAVFKPDLNLEETSGSAAEVAAYKASTRLKFPFIPPTILRTIDTPPEILHQMNIQLSSNCQKSMTGSLQLLVETDIDLLQPDNEYGNYRRFIREMDVQDDAGLRIFYFIFGQWDSGQHNLLAFDDGKKRYPVAIDNAEIKCRQYAKFGDHPFVRWVCSEDLSTDDSNKPFPFDSVECIEISEEERLKLKGRPEGEFGRELKGMLREKLKKRFGNKLPGSFYESFDCYNARLHYVVYDNALWRQYHASDDEFIKAFSNKCNESIIRAIKRIDLAWLREVFPKSCSHFNDQYFEMILERRNQVLDYYRKMRHDELIGG